MPRLQFRPIGSTSFRRDQMGWRMGSRLRAIALVQDASGIAARAGLRISLTWAIDVGYSIITVKS